MKKIILSRKELIFSPQQIDFSVAKNGLLESIKKINTKHQNERRKERLEKIKNFVENELIKNYGLKHKTYKRNLTNKKINMSKLENYIKQNYPIQTGLNNPILRTKSKKVEKITPEIKEFAKILMKAMEMYDGIGLAAPQIGENIRIIAAAQLSKDLKNIIWADVLINPEIIWHSDETYLEDEACLSLPGLEGKVRRYKKIKVKYTTINGEEKIIEAEGLNAAIFQHEIDHLDGILFWDKVENKKGLNLNKVFGVQL